MAGKIEKCPCGFETEEYGRLESVDLLFMRSTLSGIGKLCSSCLFPAEAYLIGTPAYHVVLLNNALQDSLHLDKREGTISPEEYIAAAAKSCLEQANALVELRQELANWFKNRKV